jgi:hypothetical protein
VRDGGLTAPRLAYEPEDLALVERERDAVDGVDTSLRTHESAFPIEVLDEVDDLQHGRVRHAVANPGRKQATR